jgi:GDP-4-dehydro-6-deoxy-D-mannose reductase
LARKALVTGYNGFAGFHLIELLLNHDYEIIGLDMIDDAGARFARFKEEWRNKITSMAIDLRDSAVVDEIIKQYSPDLIFHLAAQSSVKLSFENPAETMSININGTLNILQSILNLKNPPATMLISSSEIYGQLTPDQVPVTEDAPLRPVNPYAVSKAAVDLLAYQYFKAYGLPIYCVRAFSHSGPGQKTVAVLSDWAFQTAEIELGLKPPEIKVGNMEVIRDYTDVRDTVRAYWAIITKGQSGRPYNVCSGLGYPLADLLKIITSFSTRKIKLIADPSRLRPVDIPILIGSPERLKSETGWEPKIAINQTLRDLYDYWINQLVPQI